MSLSYRSESAYGIAVLAMRLILRAARESEDDAIEELQEIANALRGGNAMGSLLSEAKSRMNDFPVRLAFAFVVVEKEDVHRFTNLRFEFVKRMNLPTYQGFCVEHADCKRDYELSIACEDGRTRGRT